jgi:UTP--glucose-1-phosphate uridylyltransferase
VSDLNFDAETRASLDRYGFDEATFNRLREELRRSPFKASDNHARGVLEPYVETPPGLPARGTPAREELAAIGRQAIKDGQVGVLLLAGGMATRLGGTVKALLEIVPGVTLLDAKLADVAAISRATGGHVPVYLMTSFATNDRVCAALAARGPGEPAEVHAFPQFVSVRLTPEGDVFRGADGRPSLYGPGHGDLPFAFAASGQLKDFRARGGRMVLVSNIDNVAAALDPAVIGAHLRGGCPITVEVARKYPGDKGGAPALLDGRAQIVEGFRFPPGFEQDRIPVFNTNTFVFDLDTLDPGRQPLPLDWFRVEKKVDGRTALQFERLAGQLTALFPTQFLLVDRSGPDTQFQPIKDFDELNANGPAIVALLRERGLLPG